MPYFKRFDLIQELLLHNLIHIVEAIFDYVGFPWTWSCLRVNKIWYDFLTNHIFPRWADKFLNQHSALRCIYSPKELKNMNSGKICWQFYKLKKAWQNQKKIFKGLLGSDNVVLSVKVHQNTRCLFE